MSHDDTKKSFDDMEKSSPTSSAHLESILKGGPQLKTVVEPLLPTAQLFNIIPRFSEKTKNLNSFLNNCELVNRLSSPIQKQILLPHIISQLDGKAASFANTRIFTSVNDFVDEIRKAFSDPRSISEILLEIQQTKQKGGSIAEYIDKISSLRDELLASDSLINDQKGQLRSEYDKLILNNFLVGLEPNFYHRVRAFRPANTVEAFRYCKEEDRALKFYYNAHQSELRNSTSFSSSSRYQVQNKNRLNSGPTKQPLTSERFCSHCKINGHTIEYCRKKNNQPSTSNKFDNKTKKPINHLNSETEVGTEQTTSDEEEQYVLSLLEESEL